MEIRYREQTIKDSLDYYLDLSKYFELEGNDKRYVDCVSKIIQLMSHNILQDHCGIHQELKYKLEEGCAYISDGIVYFQPFK